MFERLIARAGRAAERRAALRRERIAARLREDLPPGVRVEADEEGVAVSGRRLDALRWTILGAIE